MPLAELSTVCRKLQAEGRRVALCHGVFDLLHAGHLRHLEAARQQGDVLVVTVTCDEYVNKGPDRPAFGEELRAEMLAALDLVDYVAIVHEPSATVAIDAVRPAAYIKGGEYDDLEKDITGKIVVEKEAVERHGGALVFTHDVTFSSSNLLNRFFSVGDGDARDYLESVGRDGLAERLDDLFARIAKLRLLIVGETIIDRYIYVDALGKSAKENIIATHHRGEELFAGGVIAAANHLAALCPNIELVTTVGSPNLGENYETFARESLDKSITPYFFESPESPTVQKTRFVEPTHVQKLFEVYHMNDQPLSVQGTEEFQKLLRARMVEVDAVIVCDFGHGAIQGSSIQVLTENAKFLAVNAQSNAGNIGYNLVNKYTRADFLCIDTMEARLAVQEKHADPAVIADGKLQALVQAPNIVITHGKHGCYASNGDRVTHIPAFASNVIDTVGAGDAFFVAAAAVMAAGGECVDAAFLGNVAGGLKTAIVGHRRALTKLELQRYIQTLLK